MKNSIWVGKNKCGGVYVFTGAKPFVKNGELCGNWYGGAWFADLFELDLKTLEIVELIFDTDTGKVEVKRAREIGWYLTANDGGRKGASAYHWNGSNWGRNRKGGCFIHKDGTVTVISEKLPDNEYLKGLE